MRDCNTKKELDHKCSVDYTNLRRLFPSNDRRFGVLLFKGEEIRKGGGGVDREAVREVFLPRREDCLE